MMPVISIPMFCRVLTAVSRPDPLPDTITSSFRTPCSAARRAASSAATWAAYGVDLRDPLKPTEPPEVHTMVLPAWSVMVMIVLLKLALMWAWAWVTFLRSLRLTLFCPCCFATVGCSSVRSYYFLPALFLPAIGTLGPLRVRALVWVRCPLTGRPRRWRIPW